MAFRGYLTVAQWIKAKGGEFRTSIQSGRLRVDIELVNQTFCGITGLDVEGLRTVERIFLSVTGIEPAQVSPAACGLTRDYLVKQFEGSSLAECLGKMDEAIKGGKAELCPHGFSSRCPISGTMDDLIAGKVYNQYNARNEREKLAMSAMLRADGCVVEWEDLSCRVVEEEAAVCACEEQLECIFKLWNIEDYKKLNSTRVIVGDSNRIIETAASSEEKFFLLLDQAINTWPIAEQERIYWGGGVKGIGKNRSVGSALFPVTEDKIPFSEFFGVAVERCLGEWDFDLKNKSIKADSVEDFVLGQMLRIKGQLVIDRGQRALRYEPTPAAYLKNIKQ